MKPRAEIRTHVHNHFRFKVQHKDGTITEFKAQNLVLDRRYNQTFFTSETTSWANAYKRLYVGTSAAEPQPSGSGVSPELGSVSLTVKTEWDSINERQVYTLTGTVSEATLNGVWASVSVGGDLGKLTHALITDSEGQPMSFIKTNTDIVKVTAVVYQSIDFGDNIGDARFIRPPSESHNKLSETYAQLFDFSTSQTKNLLRTSAETSWGSFASERLYYCSSRFWYDRQPYVQAGNESGYSTSHTYTVLTNPPGVIEHCSFGGNLSSWGNLAKTWIVRSIQFRDILCVQFPNHNIFPPRRLHFELTGDGVTKDFRIDVPILMKNSAEYPVLVQINNTVISDSDYIWCGKDFTNSQAWLSGEEMYYGAKNFQEVSSKAVSGVWLPYDYEHCSLNSGTHMRALDDCWYWDFEQPITVNTFCCRQPTSYSVSSSHPYDMALEYSSDNENWQKAAEFEPQNPRQCIQFTPVSSRYWRVTKIRQDDDSSYTRDPVISLPYAFDYIDPAFDVSHLGDWDSPSSTTIHFNTAPTADSVIEIEAWIEYPIKNDKWRMDQFTVDITTRRNDENDY